MAIEEIKLTGNESIKNQPCEMVAIGLTAAQVEMGPALSEVDEIITSRDRISFKAILTGFCFDEMVRKMTKLLSSVQMSSP